MTGKTTWVWAVLVLVVLGIAGIILRQNFNLEVGDNDYLLKYKAAFHVRKPDGRLAAVADARLLASIPEPTRYCKVVKHDFDPPDLEQVRYRANSAESRKNIVLRFDKAGQFNCEISFRLRLDPNGDWRQGVAEPPLTPRDRSAYLSNGKGMVVKRAKNDTAQEILNRLRDDKPKNEQLAHRIFEECRSNIESTGELGDDDGNNTLAQLKGSPVGRARAMVILCRTAGIPARLAVGFEIKKAEQAQPRTWVEAYLGNRWVPYDLEDGHEGELPYYFVAVRHEGLEPLRITNSTDIEKSYSITDAPPEVQTMLSILDLHNLSPKLKEPVKVVLILPLGALFTAFVRTIIGIRTFGTFSPTLLALAFVYNDFLSGMFIFVIVLTTGFVSRGVLDRLKLLLVPRLGIILTLVVMLMVLGIAITNYIKQVHGEVAGGQTVLLPMVILTNLVERFYVTSEEDSFLFAVRLMVTTMLMALAIYLLLNWRALGDALFDYPELHAFTVAVLIAMGRYTGFRVTELVRFRDLVQGPKE